MVENAIADHLGIVASATLRSWLRGRQQPGELGAEDSALTGGNAAGLPRV